MPAIGHAIRGLCKLSFIDLGNQLLSQFDHRGRVFFILDSLRYVAPIFRG